jgi:thymidylate synthase
MKEIKFKNLERELKKNKTLFNIYFDYDFQLPKVSINPDMQEDEDERLFLVNQINIIADKLRTDKFGRQCAFTLTYDGFFTKCPSLIHLYKQNRTLKMTVYMRSWNFLRNFDYDIATFNLLMFLVAKKLNIKPSSITFICHSLHLNPKQKIK